MKFGKSLIRVVELSDPEWGPYWMNYKFLKKKIKEIVNLQGGKRTNGKSVTTRPSELSKNAAEVEFFTILKNELKKTSDFFTSTEQLYAIRKVRVWEAFSMLKDSGSVIHDKNTWTRLLQACVNFYKDVLLLENFAIMSYCGFSKILKKHDKITGYVTRDAYMRNVVNKQNFTHYPYVLSLIHDSEQLFADIQGMESVMPLQDEERLFLEAIRDLNYQASRLQQEEKPSSGDLATTSTSTAVVVAPGTSGQVSGPVNREMGTVAVIVEAAEDEEVRDCRLSEGVDMETGAAAEATGGGGKRGTSFNPYHGPSFITAIPDSSTPYISSMCIIDPSDRLDAATSLAIDAALRLRHSSPATATAPSLHSIVSLYSDPGTSNKKQQQQQTVSQAQFQPLVRAGAATVNVISDTAPLPPPYSSVGHKRPAATQPSFVRAAPAAGESHYPAGRVQHPPVMARSGGHIGPDWHLPLLHQQQQSVGGSNGGKLARLN